MSATIVVVHKTEHNFNSVPDSSPYILVDHLERLASASASSATDNRQAQLVTELSELWEQIDFSF